MSMSVRVMFQWASRQLAVNHYMTGWLAGEVKHGLAALCDMCSWKWHWLMSFDCFEFWQRLPATLWPLTTPMLPPPLTEVIMTLATLVKKLSKMADNSVHSTVGGLVHWHIMNSDRIMVNCMQASIFLPKIAMILQIIKIGIFKCS